MAQVLEYEDFKINTPIEFANALLHLQRNSQLTMTALSKKVDPKREDLVSWLLSPLKPRPPRNAPKRVDAELAMQVAAAAKGEGQLVNDTLALFLFLLGVRRNPLDVLRPDLRLVQGSNQPPSDASDNGRFVELGHLRRVA